MKRKFIFTLGIASLICSNAFAMGINGGHLLSHKESTTGSGKAIFKETNAKSHELSMMKNVLKLQQRSNQNQFVSANVQAKDVDQAMIGYSVLLSGMHRGFVYNSSPDVQKYAVRHKVCLYKLKSDSYFLPETCASSIDQVEIDPKGMLDDDKEIDLNVLLHESDVTYYEHVETIVFNEVGDTIFSSTDIKPIVLVPPHK